MAVVAPARIAWIKSELEDLYLSIAPGDLLSAQGQRARKNDREKYTEEVISIITRS